MYYENLLLNLICNTNYDQEDLHSWIFKPYFDNLTVKAARDNFGCQFFLWIWNQGTCNQSRAEKEAHPRLLQAQLWLFVSVIPSQCDNMLINVCRIATK